MQLNPTNQKLNATHVDFETFAELIKSEPQRWAPILGFMIWNPPTVEKLSALPLAMIANNRSDLIAQKL